MLTMERRRIFTIRFWSVGVCYRAEDSECHFLLAKCYYRLGELRNASIQIDLALDKSDAITDHRIYADIRFFSPDGSSAALHPYSGTSNSGS